MDGTGRIVSIRSGRKWSDWAPELRINGDELKWKFNSDGSVNGWGWKFTVYPVMPASGPYNTQRFVYILPNCLFDIIFNFVFLFTFSVIVVFYQGHQWI